MWHRITCPAPPPVGPFVSLVWGTMPLTMPCSIGKHLLAVSAHFKTCFVHTKVFSSLPFVARQCCLYVLNFELAESTVSLTFCHTAVYFIWDSRAQPSKQYCFSSFTFIYWGFGLIFSNVAVLHCPYFCCLQIFFSNAQFCWLPSCCDS